MEYRLVLPDGDTRWVATRGRVEVDDDGRPALLRGATRDVTARKNAEQETQRLRQELAHAGRVSLMGQLASALAHEINQPLGAILRNAETANLLMRQAAPDLDELRGIVEDIRKDDERAAAVIQRIRGLLKRHALETQQLDVGVLVGDVAALVRGDAATRGVRLNVSVPRGLPPVAGDRIHLQQVLLNLILNGMDSLHATSADRRDIGVTARVEHAELVEVAVDDAGPGIPPTVLPQIFEPFFTTKPDGMGMGLAISRSIVEAHGGRLWAENKAGGGAAFRFTLRVAGEPPAH
jgi:C4-dicarboxylate-specific signal transduction histidine kinase